MGQTCTNNLGRGLAIALSRPDAAARTYPHPFVDGKDWEGIYRLKGPGKKYLKSWGAVDFTLMA